jgi:hypothetical protein
LKFQFTSTIGKAACLIAALPLSASAWTPGVYPTAPNRMATTGFTVDNFNRNDVVAFWQAVYMASEGYQERVDWSGNYSGKSGTTSNEFLDDVERRVNFFRALCGVPPIVRVNSDSTVLIDPADPHKPSTSTLKSDAAQEAALMLIRNYDSSTGSDPAINHDPPKGLVGWSAAAWNANANGNLAFGIYGPGAITEYMVEELAAGSTTSVWNTLVGHRRWISFPEATDFATGDQPGDSVARPPTNVLYVSQKPSQLKPDPTPDFVAYPSPGFFPSPINSRYWSLSRAGADFTQANVRMTDQAGRTVGISNIKRNANYGDPAIIWEVGGSAASRNIYNDTTFKVYVSGIGGTGIPTTYNYTVTLINPDRLTSSLALNGPSTPISTSSTPYTFTPPTKAEGLGVTAFRRKAADWKEGAEKSSKSMVVDGTAKNYPLMAKMAKFGGFGILSGKNAFHLTFPVSYDLLVRGVPQQSFELNRMIIPGKKAKLQFLYRRGFMTKGSTMVVERSSDNGLTWSTVGKPIKGLSDNNYDTKVSSASISLPKSDQPIRIRFRYFTKPGAPIYTHEAAPTSPTGIFIDDIRLKNSDWLEASKTIYLANNSKQYSFNTSSAGSSLVEGSRWCLGLQAKLGGKWFPVGPVKTVFVKAP